MDKKQLPLIPFDRADDLHNLKFVDAADLVLFMAGNQFMAMKEIVSAFQEEHPDIRRIYYQTLPPGLQLKQILAGGAVFRDKILEVYPDIYTSVNQNAMRVLEQSGHIHQSDYRLYLRNCLTLMVPEGNPAQITSVSDLGRDNVRISQPDPENEDIGFHIIDMYRQAGGDDLVRRIMEEKRAEGTTIFTTVHHRETPLRISKLTVDVGPVWATEVIHARLSGLACEAVVPGEELDQRDNIGYYVCKLKNVPHPKNAQKFFDFIISTPCQSIYQKYGFLPHSA
jgi:ABC-type molybdate transport system substrate-binding protein